MFQEPIITGARIHAWPETETTLRGFLASHMESLSNAAALLAGRKGVRIVENIRMGLEQPGPIARRIRRLLLELLDILSLQNVHDEDTEEAACFATIDPAAPIVMELCLLSDELREALLSAGFDGSSDPGR